MTEAISDVVAARSTVERVWALVRIDASHPRRPEVPPRRRDAKARDRRRPPARLQPRASTGEHLDVYC